MKTPLNEYIETRIAWKYSGIVSDPFVSTVNGKRLVVAINDVPEIAERKFTLFVDGIAIGSFDKWPTHWSRRRALGPMILGLIQNLFAKS